METFAEFFKYGEPATKLPEFEVKMPVGALALAIAAVIHLFNFPFKFGSSSIIRCALILYQDDHLEYKDDVLYIKKEKVLDKRALKGNIGAADNSTTDNKPVFKEIRLVKLDFSATNFKAKVTEWCLSIEKKLTPSFLQSVTLHVASPALLLQP